MATALGAEAGLVVGPAVTPGAVLEVEVVPAVGAAAAAGEGDAVLGAGSEPQPTRAAPTRAVQRR